MHYFSTNRSSPRVSFREAVLSGQPDDRGLYFPERIPQIADIAGLLKLSNAEIAREVIKPFVGDEIPGAVLGDICADAVNFPFPLVEVSDRIFALELFHGPTMAFKDVGARFMSRCLGHFRGDGVGKTLVIVATSGDTGGAVANGFVGVEGIEVVILYPKGRVSRLQELQLTTPGRNITALEVDGNFDDCQRIAKLSLADDEIQKRAFVTSANSINIARWLPQQFYYFFAMKQWEGPPPVFSVPSGNFGNICAGLLAWARGLPSAGFLAACNANRTVPEYMDTQRLEPRVSVATLSNAMDVGDPSNFSRVLEIFDSEFPRLAAVMSAESVSDDPTAETMREVYERCGYILDPHGAVGYAALRRRLDGAPGQRGIFLATAHPAKFDSVNEIIGTSGELPAAARALMERQGRGIEVPARFDAVKALILERV
jgi:threonine synthase